LFYIVPLCEGSLRRPKDSGRNVGPSLIPRKLPASGKYENLDLEKKAA